jgi:TonB family protein
MSASHPRCRGAVRRSIFQLVFMATLATLYAVSHAQTPAGMAPATGTAPSASERAQREGDKAFQWIRIHSEKPRKSPGSSAANRPAAVTTAASVTEAAKAASKTRGGTTETVKAPAPPSARKEALAAAKPPAAAPQPEPAITTVAAKGDASVPKLPAVSSPVVEEDAQLNPVVRTEPDFSSALMRQLRRGLVQVGFTVNPDGSVAQVHAVSSTSPRLVATALATVSQWRFRPLRHAQQGVVDLGFNLD